MNQTLKYFDCNLFVYFFTYVPAYLLTFLISYFRNSRFLSNIKCPDLSRSHPPLKIVLQLAKACNKYILIILLSVLSPGAINIPYNNAYLRYFFPPLIPKRIIKHFLAWKKYNIILIF